MVIGEIAGELASVVVAARRSPSDAIARRTDGRVFMISVISGTARPAVRPAWVPGSSRMPSVECRWLTPNTVVALTSDGELHVLSADSHTANGLKSLSRFELADRYSDGIGNRSSLAMTTSQDYPVAGIPFVTVIGDRRVVQLEMNTDNTLDVERECRWPSQSTIGRTGGPALSWVNSLSVLRGHSTGTTLAVTKIDLSRDVADVTAMYDFPVLEPTETRYPILSSSLPVRSGRAIVGMDMVLVYPSGVWSYRLNTAGEAAVVPQQLLTPDPGCRLTAVDLRDGLALVGSSGPGGGAVDVIDWDTRQPVWRFEIVDPAADVFLLTDPRTRKTRAVAIDEAGRVHAWTVGWPDRVHHSRSQGLTPQSSGPVLANSVRTLDLD